MNALGELSSAMPAVAPVMVTPSAVAALGSALGAVAMLAATLAHATVSPLVMCLRIPAPQLVALTLLL